MTDQALTLPAPTRGYVSIQALRALAAVAVVLFHLIALESSYLPGPPIAPRAFALGDIGVDLFFVISGFIIVTSTRGWFRDRQRAGIFLWRRLTRIYPIYWAYFAVLLLAYLAVPDVFSGHRGKPDLLTSFFLLPSQGTSLLLVAWTLKFEVQFYVLFALALCTLPERWLLTALGGWTAAIAARHLLVPSSIGLFNGLFDLLNLDFIAGCLVARLAGNVSRPLGLISLATGVALVVGGCIVFGQPDGRIAKGWPSVLTCGGGFALILVAVVTWEDQICRVLPRGLVTLGDSSYSLYLSHLLTCALVGRSWHMLFPHPGAANHALALGLAVAAALFVGWLSFAFLERPLLGISRALAHSAGRNGWPDIRRCCSSGRDGAQPSHAER